MQDLGLTQTHKSLSVACGSWAESERDISFVGLHEASLETSHVTKNAHRKQNWISEKWKEPGLEPALVCLTAWIWLCPKATRNASTLNAPDSRAGTQPLLVTQPWVELLIVNILIPGEKESDFRLRTFLSVDTQIGHYNFYKSIRVQSVYWRTDVSSADIDYSMKRIVSRRLTCTSLNMRSPQCI